MLQFEAWAAATTGTTTAPATAAAATLKPESIIA